jgi:hypothetical protein
MGQRAELQDFMLIARCTGEDAVLHARIEQALRLAAAAHPQMRRLADFDLGARQHVEVISAPDRATARSVVDMVNGLEGVKAELAPMRGRW